MSCILWCRKQHTQRESTKSRNTISKDVRLHRGTTSDHSSMELDEHCDREAEYDRRQNTQHDSGDKHAARASASEESRCEKYRSISSNIVDSSSTKDFSDRECRAESKYHRSKQTDVTVTADSRKHEQETETRKKRKQNDGVEVDTSGSSSGSRLNSNSKHKQAKAESEQPAVQSKAAKQTVGTVYENAVARYLARKGKLNTPVVCEDSD